MFITLSMICYFLEKHHYTIFYMDSKNDIEIKKTALLDHSPTEPNTLYITDNQHVLDVKQASSNSAYMIISNDVSVSKSITKSKCVFVQKSDTTPISLLHKVYEIIFTLQKWDLSLKDCLLNKPHYQELFLIAEEVISLPFIFVDKYYNVLQASTNYLQERPNHDLTSVPSEYISNHLLVHDEYLQSFMVKEPHIFPSDQTEDQSLFINIFDDNHFEARIMILLLGTPITKGLQQILKHLAWYAKKIYLVSEKDKHARIQTDSLHSLVRDLVSGIFDMNNSHAQQTLNSYGWLPEHPFTLVVFSGTDNEKFEHCSMYICKQLESTFYNSCAITSEGKIYLLLNHALYHKQENTAPFQKTVENITSNFSCKSGISSMNKLSDFSILKHQAHAALQFGQLKHPSFNSYHFSDYALQYIVKHATSEYNKYHLIHPGVLTLIKYDTKHRTELLHTLQCYISNFFNVAETSKNLFIHRTTLFRRLEKIQELSNIDFSDYESIVHVQVSLLMIDDKTN